MGQNKLQGARPPQSKRERITAELFGEDHWSLFAYVQGCCEGNVGRVEPEFMRCSWANRTRLGALGSESSEWGPVCGTRLKGYHKQQTPDLYLAGHDDWDCLADFEAAGLLEVVCYATGLVHLTPKGLRAGAALRDHQARGGSASNFSIGKSSAGPITPREARPRR